MIARASGMRHSNRTVASICLYHKPMLYLEAEAEDISVSNNAEIINDWAWDIIQRAKPQFPLVKFSYIVGCHDDNRLYIEVKAVSETGQNEEAMEWLNVEYGW